MSRVNQEHLALRALDAYSIASEKITFLRQNENLVFRVVDGQAGDAYLLRIHVPLTKAFQACSAPYLSATRNPPSNLYSLAQRAQIL